MAKIIYTAAVSDIRGKYNGSVFSKNKFAAYIRNKVTPVNRRTSSQTTVRTRLATYSQNWRGLTSAQRQQWNDATANFPRTNAFGQQYFLTGAQLYQGFNNNLANTSSSAITAPPSPGTVTGPVTLALTAAKGSAAVSLAFTASPVPANTAWLVFATDGVSAGITFVKPRYRQISVLAAAATSPSNLLTAYTTKFGAVPAAGLVIWIKIVPINTQTGQAGAELQTSAVVAA